MIRNTFMFIPKVGKKTEAGLWNQGILDWNDLRQELERIYPDQKRQQVVGTFLAEAGDALARNDIMPFARHLPQQEHWRLYREFRKKTVFLDIETTGLSPYYDTITVIGTHDGIHTNIFLKDTNLDEIGAYLSKFSIIVTFNGKLFDVPFIRKFFPEIQIPPVHIDLRFLLKSIGFSGPLKKIERTLGLVRDESIRDIDGREAVVLWKRFIRGDDDALRDLVHYNVADTIGLRKLMDFCYAKKLEQECLPLFRNEAIREKFTGLQKTIDEELRAEKGPPVPVISVMRRRSGLLVLCDGNNLLSVSRETIRRPEVALPGIVARIPPGIRPPVSMGIDLTASPARPSGLCVLRGSDAFLSLPRSDAEIIAAVEGAQPDIIAIDCSLSLPKGRCCTSDTCECRKFGITRECERELKRRGIHVFPTLIPSMQEMTRRGIGLASSLRGSGFCVIESFPGAVQDILGFPRKQVHLRELETDLMNMGIAPHADREVITHDQIDALTNAVAGFFYLAGAYEVIGDPEEGLLVIPRPDAIRE